MFRRALPLVVTAALVMSGCAQVHPLAQDSTPATSIDHSADPAHRLQDAGGSPALLDTTLIEDYGYEVSTRTSYQPREHLSWPTFDLVTVDASIRAEVETRSEPATATVAGLGGELNISWNLIGASADLIGVLVDTVDSGQSGTVSTWQSYWFSPSGQLSRNRDLLDPLLAPPVLLEIARNRLAGKDPGADSLLAAKVVGFTLAGDLVLGYDQCQLAACDAGRLSITVPGARASQILSPLGRSARAAVMSPVAPHRPATSQEPPSPTTAATRTPESTAKPSSKSSKVNCRKQRCIALTFDDGPGPHTARLVKILAKHEVKATFFMLGQQVRSFPREAALVARAGHEIASHTWDHRDLTSLTPSRIAAELSSTASAIKQRTGKKVSLLRPPYGAFNADVRKAAKKAGLPLVLWDVDTLDWKTRNAKKTVAAAVKNARRGSIILMHDIHPSSVTATGQIIAKLKKKGYRFVTVSQLIGTPKPGSTTFNGRR